ncbi:MAG: GNAT family N-acetyltransferase [Desulfobacteraceae bacterium]|nr:GNAT family N-acetyltransferase [Desulfobacteraceae bacterium]
MQIKFKKYMIRSWEKEDAPVIARYANNRNIWINLRDRFPHPYSVENANEFIANALAKEPETFFAIASLKEAIGSIGFTFGQDVHRYTAELGYWLAEPYWNQGIMSEAIQILTEYAFEIHDLNRIYAEPYATNPTSAKVLEKAGFLYEGRLKANVHKDGRVLDQFIYAKTKNT